MIRASEHSRFLRHRHHHRSRRPSASAELGEEPREDPLDAGRGLAKAGLEGDRALRIVHRSGAIGTTSKSEALRYTLHTYIHTLGDASQVEGPVAARSILARARRASRTVSRSAGKPASSDGSSWLVGVVEAPLFHSTIAAAF